MKLLRVVTVILTCFALTVPASAYSFFPWTARYSGYGYGYGYGCGYRSCGYVPAPCSVSYGCNTGCGTCFQPSCGSCGSCGTCATSCGSSCGSSCGTSCGSSCGATQVRKEPAPDPISRDRRSNEGAKTFEGSDSNYNGDPDNTESESGVGEFGGSADTDADTRTDDFGSGGSSTSDEAERWSPGGNRSEEAAPFGLDDIPNGNDFEGNSSRKPPTEGTGETGTADEASETGPVDFEARKPPVDEPVDESDTDESKGTEVESTDFLPPPAALETSGRRAGFLTARESRSNHFGVLSHSRLATGSARSAANATTISSGRTKQAPARWISVPRPAGRIQI